MNKYYWCDELKNECVLCINKNISETVKDIKSWNKYGVTNNINTATMLVIGFLLASVVIAMIFANHNYGNLII